MYISYTHQAGPNLHKGHMQIYPHVHYVKPAYTIIYASETSGSTQFAWSVHVCSTPVRQSSCVAMEMQTREMVCAVANYDVSLTQREWTSDEWVHAGSAKLKFKK